MGETALPRVEPQDCVERKRPVNGMLERLQSSLLIGRDSQYAIQLGDLEDIENLFGDLAQHQFPLNRLQLAVKGYQFAQCGAGHELDVAEIQ